MRQLTTTTPWLGRELRRDTRPVRSKRPTAPQVAETVMQEMKDPGYMVSFFDGDDIDIHEALLILSRAVIKHEKAKPSPTAPRP